MDTISEHYNICDHGALYFDLNQELTNRQCRLCMTRKSDRQPKGLGWSREPAGGIGVE